MVQKWLFFKLLFLGNIGQENVFYDILDKKKAFLGYRNKKFQKTKNWHFSKGVKPSFWSKNGHFSKLFFLGNMGQENVFYDILQPKNSFLGYKNQKFKSQKIDIFPKGLAHGLGPKIIPTSFFKHYRQGKCLLRYFTTKKLLSRL